MLKDHPSLVLRNSLLLVDFSLKRLSVTIFNNKDLQILIFVDIEALQQIGTITLVHQSRLRLRQSQLNRLHNGILIALYLTHIDQFDRYLLFGLVIHPPEDTSI